MNREVVMYKRAAIFAVVVLICVSLAACVVVNLPSPHVEESTSPSMQISESPSQMPSDPTSAEPTQDFSEIDNSATAIEMLVHERVRDNIAEIPYITYDETQTALAEFGGKNSEIERLNDDIRRDIQTRYDDFIEAHGYDNFEWTEIYAYPFADEKALQIVVVLNEYPNYGTDGEVFSYYFDLVGNHYITLDEKLDEYGLSRETVGETADILELYAEENVVQGIEAAGFVTHNGETHFLLMLDLFTEGADSWSYFYDYCPGKSTLTQMNPNYLFDSGLLIEMSPPLTHESYKETLIDNSIDFLFAFLGSEKTEGKAIMHTGEELIEGDSCQTFVLGRNTPDMFITLEHYAVGLYNTYCMDMVIGEWIPLTRNS